MNELKLSRLIDILSMQAQSFHVHEQIDIAEAVLEILKSQDISVTCTRDTSSNYYITKRTTNAEHIPAVVAHLDQVHKYYEDYQIHQRGDILFATTLSHNKKGIVQVGTGGDDLVGVWVALEALIELPDVKVVLFQDEEIGCVGSGQFDVKFFEDCSFILQADRRGDTKDWITFTNGVKVQTKSFNKAAKNIYHKYGYSANSGSITDVGKLVINGAGCLSLIHI